jgi:hypothetical protein
MAPRASDSSGRPKDTSRDRLDVGAASARRDGPKPIANNPTRGAGLVQNGPNSNVPHLGSKPAAESRRSYSGFEIASMAPAATWAAEVSPVDLPLHLDDTAVSPTTPQGQQRQNVVHI